MRNEKPILFSSPMIQGILAGRKTQTRRILEKSTECKGPYNPDYLEMHKNSKGWAEICPYGKIGDELWVRETWQGFRQTSVEYDEWEEMFSPKDRHERPYEVVYKADGKNFPEKWQPSIHMPRAYSRIQLRVTGIRIERLHEISEADAIAEGIFFTDYGKRCFHLDGPPVKYDPAVCKAPPEHHNQCEGWSFDKTTSSDQCLGTAKSAFYNLWIMIHGNDSYKANPFLWVVEFERLKQ